MNNLASRHKFQAVIVSVVSHNADNGFCVIRVKPTSQEGKDIVRSNAGGKEYTTVVGVYFNPEVGHYVTCEGQFSDSKWGIQLKASSILITSIAKQNHEDDAVFSRLFSQASLSLREALTSRYSGRVFSAILSGDTVSDGLVSQDINDRLSADVKRFSKVMETYYYLRGLGVSIDASDSIIECFGNSAKEIISSDPYRLLTVTGVGFSNIDTAAKSMGLGMTSSKRIGYGFNYIINNYLSQGHSGFYLDDMTSKIAKTMKLEPGFVAKKLIELVNQGQYMLFNRGDKKLLVDYLSYTIELDVARNLVRLSSGNPKKISRFDVPTGFLNTGQIKAVNNTISNKLSIITGGPGVGKTTVLATVLDMIDEHSLEKNKILLAAPTGQAADKMTKSTKRDAQTIHDLLQFVPGKGFMRNEGNPIECDTIVVDELSMVDLHVFQALLKAIPKDARVILMGDVDQLPSIGPGAVLRNIISSRRFCVSKLTEPTRFGELSDIYINSMLVNSGKMPDLNKVGSNSFFWNECLDDESIFKSVMNTISDLHFNKGVAYKDIQILTPQKGTLVGVDSFNKEVKKLMNPSKDGKFSFVSYGSRFMVGDRVIITKNNKELDVNNGQLGHITFIDFNNRSANIDLAGVQKLLPFDFFGSVKHAYAKTIHKSQGAEYKAVIVVMSESHKNMLNVELVYTAMTRAKEYLCMAGSSSAFEYALSRKNKEFRITMLESAIEQEFSSELQYRHGVSI